MKHVSIHLFISFFFSFFFLIPQFGEIMAKLSTVFGLN